MTDTPTIPGVGVFAELNMHTPTVRAAITACNTTHPDVSAVLVAVPPDDERKLAVRLIDREGTNTIEYIVVPGEYPFLVECRVNADVVALDTETPRAFVLSMLSSPHLLGKEMTALRLLLPTMDTDEGWLRLLATYGATAIRKFWQEVWFLAMSVSIAAEDEQDEAQRNSKIESVRRVSDLLSNLRIQPTNIMMSELERSEALPVLRMFADKAVKQMLFGKTPDKTA